MAEVWNAFRAWMLREWKNIHSESLQLEWKTDEDKERSIAKLNEYVEREADIAIRWYYKSKTMKAHLSRLFRYTAILLTALAGLLPILTAIFTRNASTQGSAAVPSLVVSLFVGLASVLVLLDRFGGFSTGWIRYIKAALEIQTALKEYRMDWALLNAKRSYPPTLEQIEGMVQRAKQFLVAIQGHITKETHQWAAEFESNLAQMEKDVKAQWEAREKEAKTQLEASQPGAVELTVTNAKEADDLKFSVSLLGRDAAVAQETVQGRANWTRLSVRPGHYRLVVSAKISGKEAGDEKVIEVAPGKVCQASLTLMKS